MKSRSGEWSVLLFVAGLLVFNPPILSIFSVPELLFGVPVLYLYIFAAWAGVIVLLSLSVSRLTEPEDDSRIHLPGPVVSPEQEELVAPLDVEPGDARPDGRPDS